MRPVYSGLKYSTQTPDQAYAQRVLATNRGHWNIEQLCHYIIDWNSDEDRSRIQTGYGPENITRLRLFGVRIIKSKGVRNVSQKMRQPEKENTYHLKQDNNRR